MSLAASESPRWAWFAHHELPIGVAAFAVTAVGKILDDEIIGIVGAVFMFGFVAGGIGAIRHTGLVCEHCLDRIPTDAAVQAKRRDWALRLDHRVMARYRWYAGILLAVVAVDVVILRTNLLGAFVVWPALVLHSWVRRFHNRVAPWCPYCGGGGGGGAHPRRPVPTGSKSA